MGGITCADDVAEVVIVMISTLSHMEAACRLGVKYSQICLLQPLLSCLWNGVATAKNGAAMC